MNENRTRFVYTGLDTFNFGHTAAGTSLYGEIALAYTLEYSNLRINVSYIPFTSTSSSQKFM